MRWITLCGGAQPYEKQGVLRSETQSAHPTMTISETIENPRKIGRLIQMA